PDLLTIRRVQNPDRNDSIGDRSVRTRRKWSHTPIDHACAIRVPGDSRTIAGAGASLDGEGLFDCGDIPDVDPVGSPAGHRQVLAIGAPRYGRIREVALIGRQGNWLGLLLGVPDLYGSVIAGRGQVLAVRAPGDR